MTAIRYFDSQVYEPDCEISETEALARGIYVRASFPDGYEPEPGQPVQPERAELIAKGHVDEVIYYLVSGANEADVIARHLEEYPGISLRCTSLKVDTEFGRQYAERWFDANGQLREVMIATEDESGNPIEDVRRRPTGELSSRVTYEYDEDGELAWIREYNRDGVMVSEGDLRE